MFTWKVEDMVLMNEESFVYKGATRIFNCELELSREEKIAFVDSMYNNNFLYLLDIIEKYKLESIDMPKTKNGCPRSSSLKTWLTKNDPKMLIDRDFEIGRIKSFAFCSKRYIYDSQNDYYNDLVDEFFHLQLLECLRQERNYFKEHDEYSIAIQKLIQCVNNYHTSFGVDLTVSSNGKAYITRINDKGFYQKRPITLKEAKLLLKKYDELDAFISRLSSDINIKY